MRHALFVPFVLLAACTRIVREEELPIVRDDSPAGDGEALRAKVQSAKREQDAAGSDNPVLDRFYGDEPSGPNPFAKPTKPDAAPRQKAGEQRCRELWAKFDLLDPGHRRPEDDRMSACKTIDVAVANCVMAAPDKAAYDACVETIGREQCEQLRTKLELPAAFVERCTDRVPRASYECVMAPGGSRAACSATVVPTESTP